MLTRALPYLALPALLSVPPVALACGHRALSRGTRRATRSPLEDNIKKLCPLVSNVMMYGDKRKFNIALLTLKSVGATGELPGTHDLDGAAKAYGKTIAEACANPKLIEDITKAFKATAKDCDCTPSNAAVMQKFSVLPIDLSIATGELTATLKLKRSEVGEKYAKLIDAIYESADNVVFFNYGNVASF